MGPGASCSCHQSSSCFATFPTTVGCTFRLRDKIVLFLKFLLSDFHHSDKRNSWPRKWRQEVELLLWSAYPCACKSTEVVGGRAREESGALEWCKQNSVGHVGRNGQWRSGSWGVRRKQGLYQNLDHPCHILSKNVTELPMSWELKKVWVHRPCFFGGDNLRELEPGHGMGTADCSCFDWQWERTANEAER